MKSILKNIFFFVAIIVGVVLLTMYMSNSLGVGKDEELLWSDIVEIFEEDRVFEYSLETNGKNGKLIFKYYDEDGKERSYEYIVGMSQQVDFINQKALQNNIPKYDYKVVRDNSWFSTLVLPIVLVLGGSILIYVFMLRAIGGGGGRLNNVGKAKVKLGSNEKNPVFFRDVAGADEEKEELKEIVDFLRDPQKFTRLGARIPRGVLLVGPPGTGKTLLARAVAGEAGVPFYSISGSDFVEMYVGVGASRVRDLFETARKSPASIIFIDEIDAVGRQRGAGLGGGHDEREQTLNQLLVEMDGFGHHDGVIVIAATNRPDILDPALLRPGRFDRQVTVNAPDLKGREDILKVHSRNRPLAGDVDFKKVAQTTVGFTGADLANLLNEASILAARRNKQLVGMAEIDEATLKVMVGTEKKSMKITAEEKRKTAYHEAGHAIIAHILGTLDPVRRISIIPSGRALGYTLNPPVKDKYSVYKSELIEEIAMLLGGRAAEKIIFSDISGGASNDIQRATQIARSMVMKLGMSDKLGNIRFGTDHSSDEVFLGRDFSSSQNFSPETAAIIDSEIKRFIDEGYALAEKVLTENIDKLHFISEFLVKYETMDEEQFTSAMDGSKSIEEIADLAEEKKRKTDEENERARAAEIERQKRLEEERARQLAEEMKNDVPPADETK